MAATASAAANTLRTFCLNLKHLQNTFKTIHPFTSFMMNCSKNIHCIQSNFMDLQFHF